MVQIYYNMLEEEQQEIGQKLTLNVQKKQEKLLLILNITNTSSLIFFT